MKLQQSIKLEAIHRTIDCLENFALKTMKNLIAYCFTQKFIGYQRETIWIGSISYLINILNMNMPDWVLDRFSIIDTGDSLIYMKS